METDEAVVGSDQVAARLEAMGIEPSSIDRRTLSQIKKLEEAIAIETERYRAARSEMKSHTLSVSTLSKASGISRATFYNKPLLRKYVDAARQAYAIKDESAELERLQKELSEKNEALAKMLEREAELVILAAENRRLNRRIETLRKYIDDMPNDIRAELESWGLEPSGLGFTATDKLPEDVNANLHTIKFLEDEL